MKSSYASSSFRNLSIGNFWFVRHRNLCSTILVAKFEVQLIVFVLYRDNTYIRQYTRSTDMETFIVHPENKTQANTVKAVLKALNVSFEKTSDKAYNPSFVKKIEKSEEEFRNGQFKTVKTEDLWK